MKRVAIAGLWHETNTYSSRPTGLEDFAAFERLAGAAIVDKHAGTGTVIGGMLDEGGFEAVPVTTAGAWPSGRVVAAAFDELLADLEHGLHAAGTLDGLLLNLHGAMVAEGADDAEAVIVARCRRLVGDVPVVVVHDLHGNPSPELVSACQALIAYDTYPHVDMRERGREAAEVMQQLLGGARLGCLVRKAPLLICPLAQATAAAPMTGLLATAAELTARRGIRRVSLLPGFPYSDVARAGFSVVVTYEQGHEEAAGDAAGTLAAQVEREHWEVRRDDPAAAVADAVASPERPVVLVDVADNIGGGSPGDGTALLAELLAKAAHNAVVTLADAEVAAAAAAAGEGGRISADIGGKTDDVHGDPVPIRGEVLRITDGSYRTSGTWMTGQAFSMGTTAVIKAGGVTLVVTSRPTPPFHGEQLTSVGVDAARMDIIVAKGAIAWRAAYGDVAARVIEVDTPGICPVNPAVLPRTAQPMRV